MSTYGSLEGDLELAELLDLDIESLDGALKRLDLGVGRIHTEIKVDSLDEWMINRLDFWVYSFTNIWSRHM